MYFLEFTDANNKGLPAVKRNVNPPGLKKGKCKGNGCDEAINEYVNNLDEAAFQEYMLNLYVVEQADREESQKKKERVDLNKLEKV